MRWITSIWRAFQAWAAPRRRIASIVADDNPIPPPRRDLLLLTEGGEPWSVVMACPCGCGQRIELPLLPQVRPRWSLEISDQGHPTLHPSVWLQQGCKSHFFLQKGRIIWV